MSDTYNIQEHLEENHAGTNAKYIKNIIYGGLDGIITTFSIIAASVGASLPIKSIIALGLANLVADGLSMGLGDYLSSIFENKYILSERDKEEHEFIHNRDFEIDELKELIHTEDRLDKEDADKIVDIYTSKEKYKNTFLKYMLALELGLEVSNEDPKIQGLVTFISFICFGFIPVFFYLIFYFSSYENYNNIFIINCFISSLTMFGLGVYQSTITKQNKLHGGAYIMINGILASSTAYIIGYGIEKSLS